MIEQFEELYELIPDARPMIESLGCSGGKEILANMINYMSQYSDPHVGPYEELDLSMCDL